MTTTFYLVRHGLTAHTGHRLSGRTPGIHLSDEGRRQADLAADALARVPLRAVYSSPIERTVETARPIADRHSLDVKVRSRLSEVDYGRLSNRTFGSLRRLKLWETLHRWPSGVRFPEGETLREVQTRALVEFDRIRTDHPRASVCCVAHGDVIRLVAAHYLGVHIDLFQRLVVGPGSISVISVGDAGPRVVALNSSPVSVTGGR